MISALVLLYIFNICIYVGEYIYFLHVYMLVIYVCLFSLYSTASLYVYIIVRLNIAGFILFVTSPIRKLMVPFVYVWNFSYGYLNTDLFLVGTISPTL